MLKEQLQTAAYCVTTVFTIGVCLFAMYELQAFGFLVAEAGQRARTFEDYLAVALISLLGASLAGDYVFVVLFAASHKFSASPIIMILSQLATRGLIAAILLVRIAWKVAPSRKRGQLSIWRSGGGVGILVFLGAGVIDVGDFLMRHLQVGPLAWMLPPWPAFWMHCACAAGVVWALMIVAYSIPNRTDAQSRNRNNA